MQRSKIDYLRIVLQILLIAFVFIPSYIAFKTTATEWYYSYYLDGYVGFGHTSYSLFFSFFSLTRAVYEYFPISLVFYLSLSLCVFSLFLKRDSVKSRLSVICASFQLVSFAAFSVLLYFTGTNTLMLVFRKAGDHSVFHISFYILSFLLLFKLFLELYCLLYAGRPSKIPGNDLDEGAEDNSAHKVLDDINSSPMSKYDLLKKYKELFDSGAITEEEYIEKKKEILDTIY